MGTDCRDLEEAMAEVEAIFGTFSNNAEINSLTINNLKSRLDNVCVDKPYADIQGGVEGVLHTLAENNMCLRKAQYEFLVSRIAFYEKDMDRGEFLYDSVIEEYCEPFYIRYYKHFTFRFWCKGLYCECRRTNNYVHDLPVLKEVHSSLETRSSGNSIADSLKQSKVTAKEIETGKKVYKYVVTYESKPILVEDTGHYITLETGCYKWVEE